MRGLTKKRKESIVTLALIYVLYSTCSIPMVTAQVDLPVEATTGPFLDIIQYVYIGQTNTSDPVTAQCQALVDGDIDLLSTQIHLGDQYDMLLEASNVEISEFYRGATYQARFNCEKWPLNISGFRKAIHLAMDKNAINAIQQTWVADSPVIAAHPLSVESEMENHYYDPDVEAGAALLDSLGFLDVDSDNIREGPGGIEIESIEVKYNRFFGTGPLLEDAALEIVTALHNLNISAYATRLWGGAYADVTTGNFDVIVPGNYPTYINLDETIAEWLKAFSQYYHWSNSTFESLAEVALTSTDYDEVVNAIKQMQYILIEDAPLIVVIQLPLWSAYRTDSFNIVEHPTGGPHSFYTGLRAYNLTTNSTGDTLRWGTQHLKVLLPSYTRPNAQTNYWSSEEQLMEMMHDSLARVDMNLNVANWLAEECIVEFHEDDSTIPDGNTRITVEIVDNATFSDGQPITANDVVYSILWFRDHFEGVGDGLENIVKCLSYTDTRLEIQFSTESWWHWNYFCFLPIMPAYLPDQYPYDVLDGYIIQSDDFNENLVTSGPFMASEYVENEYIEIKQNPYYWKNPRLIQPDQPGPQPVDFTMMIVGGLIGAASVIVIGGISVVKKMD